MKRTNDGFLKMRNLGVALGVWFACFAMMSSAALAVDGGGLSTNVLFQMQALQEEKASFTAAQQKMDSQLVFAVKQGRNQPIANGAVPQLRIGAQADANGMIRLDIRATVTPNLTKQILKAGGTIITSLPQFNAITAVLPLNQVENIAGLADVKFVRAAVKGFTRTGSVDSQGDVTHRADVARSTFNVNGSNVKVGVLSDSVDFLAQAQASGDLGTVTVLPGQSGVPGSGEGTAMLEIVADLAPGAQLFFAAGLSGEAQFAKNILDLRAAGCDIIVDDIGYFDESPFQDGIVAQAVNTVTASGALYFSAAGNEGNLDSGFSGTWEGDFADGGSVGVPVNGKGGNIHSFGSVNYDTAIAGGFATVLLWSDPLGASTNDYDLYVLDSTGANIVSSSITVQNGSQDPIEGVPPVNPNERVVVVKVSGAPRFLHIDTIRGLLTIGTAGNITGHATATNAFAVAAVDVATAFPNPFSGGAANPVEFFSSDGPRRSFYNVDGTPVTPGDFSSTGGIVRLKPDITAANGVSTTLPGNSGLNPFFGTSAAAPHAAAIAALLKSYNPSLTPNQIRTVLTNTALNIMAPGWDRDSGAGIVMAYQALQGAPLPTPAPNLVIATNSISGGNGNGVIDFDECNFMNLIVSNIGTADATRIQATLSSLTPGVIIAQRLTTYPNIPTNGVATNLTPFKVSTATSFICGTPILFNLVLKSDQMTTTNIFIVNTGTVGTPLSYTNSTLVNIPDNNPIGTNSSVVVSNFSSSLLGVKVALTIIHSFDTDLTLQLIGPDGTTITLSQNNGGGGQNYGFDCTTQTIFDDAAPTSIDVAFPPYVGSFQPDQPLADFIGKTGTNVNGVWQLHVVDNAALDVGMIECWSLILTPAICTDGGGQCPGVDLGIGMQAAPNPVTVQSNLTYTISVTNNGPDTAKGVAVNQSLPSGAIFVSGTSSQGSVVSSGNAVNINLGDMAPGVVASITVIVTPTVAGQAFSTAIVGSSQTDLDPSNNSVTVNTLVKSPSADLALTLSASPNQVTLGGVLTYTVSVVNNGPNPAQNVTVTNLLPSNISVISVSSSQGNSANTPGKVIASLGTLGVGSNATVTIQVRALVIGSITLNSGVSATTADPLQANNSATLTTTVTPASDISLSMTGSPVSAAVGSNITYTLTIINFGPSAAHNVNVVDVLPVNTTLVSATSPQGNCTQTGNTINCLITNLAVNSNATVSIVVSTIPLIGQVPITISNAATVSAAEADPNTVNNSASVSTRVDNPRSIVVAAGSILAGESFSPTNGFIDPGETVTNNFRLQNIGNLNTTNLVATLLASGGVVLTNGPQTQSYGVLSAGGVGVFKPFSFAANVTNGGTLTVTLQLQDGPNNLGTVKFIYTLPAVSTFANTNTIIIPDHGEAQPASVYPSVINVTGVSGLIDRVTVTLTNVNHTFPDDIGMLLVGPAGQSTLLMGHCGSGGLLTNTSLTFSDFAGGFLPISSQIVSGTYKPTQNGSVSFPLTNTPAGPYGTNLAAFNGTNANGNWSLYVFDGSPGDQGVIVGGWSLAFATGAPVNDTVDLGVSGFAAPNPVLAGANLTYTFSITNNGPNLANTVAFTNVLPTNLNFVSAVSSAGTCSRDLNGAIYCLLTNLPVGANVTVTVVATTTVPGVVTNRATVTSVDSDLNQSDNVANVIATVSAPVVDLAVSLSALPSPAVVSNNLIFSITVTNKGPGNAINTVVTQPLGGLNFVSAISSPSLISGSNASGTATCNVGTLAPNTSATVFLTVVPGQLGVFTNVATVASASTDPNTNDNSATLVLSAVNPAPNIVAAGTILLSESFLPKNGTIDPGETVTVSFALSNSGSADPANLVATLASGNGITPLSGPQSYGVLAHGGAAKSNGFTFSATGTNGAVVSAVLQLQDGSTNLGSVLFSFNLPNTTTFTSSTGIVIPDSGPGTPYPSALNVSGITGVLSKVTVTLSNLTHAFPRDIEMLLVGPNNQTALLMASAGGAFAVTNVNITFDDAAAAALPVNALLVSGTNKLSDYAFVAPFLSPAPTGPYSTVLSAFNGTSPNGTWALYVLDDSPGDSGNIAGWALSLTAVNPVNAASDVAVSVTTPNGLIYAAHNFSYVINVTNRGPALATGLTVTETLPSGLNFVSTTAGSYITNGGQAIYNLGSLGAGSNASFTVTVNGATPAIYNSSVTVGASQTDLNPGDNVVQISTTVISPAAANLSGAAFANGTFALTLNGAPGQYVLQGSTNLTTWVTISTNAIPVSGILQVNDASAGSSSHKYYRVYFVGP